MTNKALTILVLTEKKRIYFLKRFLQFHKFHGFKILIIINKKISNYKNIHYKYSSIKSFHEKFLFGLNHIKSKYVCWIGDDDFVLKKGLLASLKQIKKDKRVSVVRGRSYKFSEKKFKIDSNYDQNHKYFLNKKSNNLKYYLKHFSSPVHGVCKTSILRKAIKFSIKNKEYKPNIFSDKIIGIFMASFGYIHYIKDNYLVKSKGVSMHNEQNNRIVKNKNHYNYNCKFSEILEVIKKNPSLINIFNRKKIKSKDSIKKNLLKGLTLLSKRESYSHKSQNVFKNTLNDILDIYSFKEHNKLFNDKNNHTEFLMIKKIVESRHE